MNYTEIIENINNSVNMTGDLRPLGYPKYCIYPAYSDVILLNFIIITIILKKWNYKLISIFSVKSKPILRILETDGLLNILSYANLFLLIYNLFIGFNWL